LAARQYASINDRSWSDSAFAMIASSDPRVIELRIAVRGRSVSLCGGPSCVSVVVPLAARIAGAHHAASI
jgi:hypothetical protein